MSYLEININNMRGFTDSIIDALTNDIAIDFTFAGSITNFCRYSGFNIKFGGEELDRNNFSIIDDKAGKYGGSPYTYTLPKGARPNNFVSTEYDIKYVVENRDKIKKSISVLATAADNLSRLSSKMSADLNTAKNTILHYVDMHESEISSEASSIVTKTLNAVNSYIPSVCTEACKTMKKHRDVMYTLSKDVTKYCKIGNS